jgi:hypothetical protein
MVFPAHSGPWLLIQFRNHFSQTVGFLGRVISPSQGRYLNTGQHKHRINAHTDIHALNEIRNHDHSVRMSESSSCLRSRGCCDRQYTYRYKNLLNCLDVDAYATDRLTDMNSAATCFMPVTCLLFILRPWRWRRHFLRNIDHLSTAYTALYPRGYNSL